jgi:uncharacterized protein (TIGR02301 family)
MTDLNRRHPRFRRLPDFVAVVVLVGCVWGLPLHEAAAQTQSPPQSPSAAATPAVAAPGGRPAGVEVKPYDDKLLRLAEVLGAVHYLRELCGANEGQLWRDRMQDLMVAEGSSPIRKARLTKGFNQGYTSYSRTYRACSPSAQTAVNRFMTEGSVIAETLVKTIP